MQRRHLLLGALFSASAARGAEPPVEVPVLCLTNTRAGTAPEAMRAFRAGVWDEALRTFANGGVALRVTERAGEILKCPSGRPRFVGLERGQGNVVLTDTIALDWVHSIGITAGRWRAVRRCT